MSPFKLIGYFSSVLVLFLLVEFSGLDRQQVLSSDRPTLATDRARQLLERGIELYERESFTSARDLWQESALLYARQQDILGEALALNNLALAQQHLGAWEQSRKEIAKSLQLLQRGNLEQQPGYWDILGKASKTRGNWQWQTGKLEPALSSWQDAAQYYHRAGNKSGIIKAQIDEAKALQALGLTLKAVKLLAAVEQNLAVESDSELQAIGLRYLGVGYRNLGELKRSEELLQQSLTIADTQRNNLTWLELGNTYRKQGQRALIIGKDAVAAEYFTKSMQAYQQAATSKTLLQAQLNQLSLLVERGEYDRAETLKAKIVFPDELSANRANIYTLLNYANSLTCWYFPGNTVADCNSQSRSTTISRFDSTNAREDVNVATTELKEIIHRAIALSLSSQDILAQAQAQTQLAAVYELEGNFTKAQQLNQQTLLLLEGKSAAELTYRLQWQLGRILKQQDKINDATIAYNQAIASLERVRENILLIDRQVQFSFRDRVEPVYREYINLLLTTPDNTAPSQENLRQAIKIIDALQVAELENFLDCDLSQLFRLDETSIDPHAAKIYPLILSDRLVTIIDLPEQPLAYREIALDRERVTTTLNTLQENLGQPGKTPEVLEQAEQIYQWLIEPLESLLADNSQLKTLVFVPDGLLRNIPFGVLYDGEEYLIEKGYALAISPQLQLFAPQPSREPLNVLTGGVSISQTIEGIEFPAIAQVQQELQQIGTEIETNDPLLNEAFTEANIKQQIQQNNFSAIHWKTHGVFSSDPAETFLVAYGDSIKANELQSLVQVASQDGQKPLELLVLSACETARGDNRAILGLAGLTVRTGARSALSTLWRADDRATTLLMTEFYQQLTQPGTTKAEALQQAQLSLLKREGYFAPHYWGTYILVGNWL